MPTKSHSPEHRVGIFGGTFDPVHHGHLIIATESMTALALDRIEFVPAGQPPHKPGQALSTDLDRVKMLELATAGRAGFHVNTTDLERSGPSYTADMLPVLERQFSGGCLYFILGADSLLDFYTWRDPSRILATARLAVATRPGFELNLELVEQHVPGVTESLDMVPTPQIDISSTEIRRRAAFGIPYWYQVPREVERYIEEHDLYMNIDGRCD